MVDEYLNGNVKDILEPMISALLIAQPEDPKFFMLHWLKNLYSLDYIIINKEKEELENLRLEVKGYKAQKTDTNKQNTEQPLEEFKNKIIDETKENLNIKEIKETEKELETNKENELEINKKSQETNNVNTETNNQNTNNNENTNKQNIDNQNIDNQNIDNQNIDNQNTNNQNTGNQNTNNENTNNQNNINNENTNDNKSEKVSKSISINDNKNETNINDKIKNENTETKNENKNVKDLINFSEESDN